MSNPPSKKPPIKLDEKELSIVEWAMNYGIASLETAAIGVMHADPDTGKELFEKIQSWRNVRNKVYQHRCK